MVKRTPLKRSPLKRGSTRLPARSRKRIDETSARTELCARVKTRDGYRCQGIDRVPHTCHGPLVVHEIIKRSAWRAGYLVDDNCITVCQWLNGWIEDHIIPVSLGGPNRVWNKVLACVTCNRAKGSATFEAFTGRPTLPPSCWPYAQTTAEWCERIHVPSTHGWASDL